jgi:ketosteroid isomerase-like protein
MRKTALMIAFLIALVAPAVAQKAKIEAVNAKWVELFNKGDFEGIAQLYTVDATAFPPGSAMDRARQGTRQLLVSAMPTSRSHREPCRDIGWRSPP